MIDRPMIGGYSLPGPRTKFCSGCKAYHPYEDFYRNLSRHDGSQGWCKKFHRAYQRIRKTAKEVE